MNSVLCITLRFLDPVPQFHGRGSDGDPEWPPSPLRLFQALVAASGTRWRDKLFNEYAGPALRWLEKIQPSVVTPGVPAESFGYRMYVPNNSGDLMTAAWARGDTETSMAKFRVEKDVRPTYLNGEAVHYLYPLADTEYAKHEQTLISAARSITHLGWGVDMVAGNAAVISEEDAGKLEGERWQPVQSSSGTQLRVPRAGTLDALMTKHAAFLNRLGKEGFKPVPPLTAFDTVSYRRDTEPATREWVAFRINSVDPDERPPSFDTARRCRDVAAWVRCATGKVCEGWPFPDYLSFVHGHDESGKQLRGEHADNRFMYLPLPSIERRGDKGEHIGAIRRVLIAAPPGCRDQIEWIRRRLPGQELIAEDDGTRGLHRTSSPVRCRTIASDSSNRVRGMLTELTSDWVLGQYTGESREWSTVTPVIRPGHDDGNAKKGGHLLLKMFEQAGISRNLIESGGLDWRFVGFRAGVDLARGYCLPVEWSKFPAYHVRVRFRNPVRGPLAIGIGRYRGFGLFAAESR